MRETEATKEVKRLPKTPNNARGHSRAAENRDAATAQRALRERVLRARARPEEERAAHPCPHPYFQSPSRGPAVWVVATDKPCSSSPAPKAAILRLNLRDGHDLAARTRTTV